MFSEMCHLSCIFHGFFGRDKAQVCLPKAVSYHDLLARIIFFSFPLVQKVTYIFCQNLKWQSQINKTLSVEDIINKHFFDKLLLLYSLFNTHYDRKRYVSWEGAKESGRKLWRNKRIKEHTLLLIGKKEE